MVFEIKKIRSETLSEYLLAVRERLSLSRKEVAEAVGMQPKFVEYLETNRLEALPADCYTIGFLRQISELYAIPADEIIAQYKKERTIVTQVGAQPPAAIRRTPAFSKILITPKRMSLAAAILFVCATLIYIIWEVASIHSTPQLAIFEPRDGAKISDSFVKVAGKTDPGVELTINDHDVFVGSDGSFETTLSLTPGQREFKFLGKNKFDKTVSKTVAVIADTPTVATADTATQSQAVSLIIQATADIQIALTVDDKVVGTEDLKTGEAKTVTGNVILLSTNDAGHTRVRTASGKDFGVLGRPGEVLEHIPFAATTEAVMSASTVQE